MTRRGKQLPWCRARSGAAFTLVELLTVVAIIGLLAALLVPTAAAARNAANRARSRTQFSQWAAGCEMFRQEYGMYPRIARSGSEMLINHAATANPAQEHLFHDTLTGQRRDPGAINWTATRPDRDPPFAERQNSRRVRMVGFGEGDFVTAADVAAGQNVAVELHLLRDAFHNTVVGVVMDANLDGVINAQDAPGGYPAVTPRDGGPAIRPSALIPETPGGGLHAGVLFYSAPPGATTEHDLVLNSR